MAVRYAILLFNLLLALLLGDKSRFTSAGRLGAAASIVVEAVD